MGGTGSGRALRPESAGTRAGLEIVRWVMGQEAGAFARLAQAAGVSPRQLARYVTGDSTPPVTVALELSDVVPGLRPAYWRQTPELEDIAPERGRRQRQRRR